MHYETITTEESFSKIKDKYSNSDISSGVLVLLGEEELFKKSLIASIKSYMFEDDGDVDMNYSVCYDKNDVISGSPLDDAETPPFGAKLRLIVVFNYDSYLDKNDFLEYAIKPSNTSLLILVSSSPIESDGIYKYFAKKNSPNLNFVHFPKPKENDFTALIYYYLGSRSKKITNDALDYLLDNVNLDYTSLYSELQKICDYHNDKPVFNIDDIKDFTYTSKHANIFDFINAILDRDRKKCFSIMSHLKEDPVSTLNLILHSFIILYFLKIFPPQTSINDMAKIINQNYNAISLKKRYINKFSLKEISFVISELSRLNTISVTNPSHILKAHFDLFLFTITK
jgi:DNA polymerase-3 subunit delta